MKKTMITLFAGLVMFSGFQAFAGPLETIAKEAGATGRAAINKNKTKVEIVNSKFKNRVDMKNSQNKGNAGISALADDVTIKNSTFDNEVKMKNSKNEGNTGMQFGHK